MFDDSVFEYPLIDRVVLNLTGWHFWGITGEEFSRVVESLRVYPFSCTGQFDDGTSVRLVFRSKTGFSGSAWLRYTKETKYLNLCVAVGFNVLRHIRSQLTLTKGDGLALSLDGNDNFLPISLIQKLGRDVVSELCIKGLVEQVTKILRLVEENIPGLLKGKRWIYSSPRISIEQIELSSDVPFENAIAIMRKLQDPVMAHFKTSEFRSYRDYKYTDANTIGISVRTRAHETLKIYAKTGRSIRVEFEFSKKRIQQDLGSNKIDIQDRDSIRGLLIQLLTKPRETLRRLSMNVKDNCSADIKDGRRLFNFIKLCDNYDILHALVSQLKVTGRVKYTSEWGYVLGRLTKAGLLRKGERGIYICDSDLVSEISTSMKIPF